MRLLKVIFALAVVASSILTGTAHAQNNPFSIGGYTLWADPLYPSLNFRPHMSNYYGELLVMPSSNSPTTDTCAEYTLVSNDISVTPWPANRRAFTMRLDGCNGGANQVTYRSLATGTSTAPSQCFDTLDGGVTNCFQNVTGSFWTIRPILANAGVNFSSGFKVGPFNLDEAHELKGLDGNIWTRCYPDPSGPDYCWIGPNGNPSLWVDPDQVKMLKPITLASNSDVTCPSNFSTLSPDKCFKIKAADGYFYAIPGVRL